MVRSQPPTRHVERERRFVVADTSILQSCPWRNIEQGYVWANDGYAIRARLESDPDAEQGKKLADPQGTITIKGPRINAERQEYEVQCAADFARAIIERAQWKIRKRRFHYRVDGQFWEIDEFLEENEGLYIAEIEDHPGRSVSDDDSELSNILTPSWVYKEVTDDKRFNNEELAQNPVSNWIDSTDWRPASSTPHD